jgi:ParB-like chromosome segregation protein Spo0J
MPQMNIELSKLKTNPNNPRLIREDKLDKLVKSLREFPEMLEARPIVVDPDYVVLGGNMRLKAARLAGLTTVPVYVASWDEAKGKQFIIKDNVGFGEWDWDMLANEWEPQDLNEWGLDVWQPEKDIDFSLLDEAEEVEHMADDIRRSVCIDFNTDDHAVVAAKIAALKKEGKDVGKMMLKWLHQA